MYDQGLRILGYLLVGSLWGCTNPFIKNAQESIVQHEQSKDKNEKLHKEATLNDCDKPINFLNKFALSNLSKLKGLFTNPQLFLPYIINQMGSLVFYVMLSTEPISRANPICNSLTFLFTAVTGYLVFGERFPSPSILIIGVIFIVSGIYICVTAS